MRKKRNGQKRSSAQAYLRIEEGATAEMRRHLGEESIQRRAEIDELMGYKLDKPLIPHLVASSLAMCLARTDVALCHLMGEIRDLRAEVEALKRNEP